MNGAKVGQTITLPEPPPEQVTIVVMVNVCKHRTETTTPLLNVTYNVEKPVNPALPYQLHTNDKTIANAYYCMECKAEQEAKYKMREIRDMINELLGEGEDY